MRWPRSIRATIGWRQPGRRLKIEIPIHTGTWVVWNKNAADVLAESLPVTPG